MSAMRCWTLALLSLALVLLSGCGGGPRQPAVPYQVAAGWLMPMTVRIDESWDLVKKHVETDNPAITHLVQVTVLQPPVAQRGMPPVAPGQVLVLPYDSYLMGQPPPGTGIELTLSPAEWVNGNPGARGRPGARQVR